MDRILRKKYKAWLEEEKKIKKQEFKLSIIIFIIVMGWGLPLLFSEDKMQFLFFTPFFMGAYVVVLWRLKKLNDHMMKLLKEMIAIKDQLKMTGKNKDIISIVKGLELYYISTSTFTGIKNIIRKIV